jgi:tRNA1(Val) A37 N6-methylase TrmN6
MERLEDLGKENIKVFQDDHLYCFTSDAILLSKFTRVKKADVVADFCSGCGIVGFNLYALNANLIDSVTLIEMQKPLYDLSVKSINLNGLQDKFKAINCKIQQLENKFAGKFSLITCNPPYMASGRGMVDEKEHIALCRAEISLSLQELVKTIAVSLKFGGRVNMVHRADRLAEVIYEFKKNNLEPKRLQMVTGGKKEPYLFIIEGVKGGKSGIKILNQTEN